MQIVFNGPVIGWTAAQHDLVREMAFYCAPFARGGISGVTARETRLTINELVVNRSAGTERPLVWIVKNRKRADLRLTASPTIKMQ